MTLRRQPVEDLSLAVESSFIIIKKKSFGDNNTIFVRNQSRTRSKEKNTTVSYSVVLQAFLVFGKETNHTAKQRCEMAILQVLSRTRALKNSEVDATSSTSIELFHSFIMNSEKLVF